MKKLKRRNKYIYGPVSSWRLGCSLGIDLISCKEKICTFDCVYCQLGRTKAFKKKREEFVWTEKVIDEIKGLPSVKIDYITFSGSGEPTLAKNLREVISRVRKIRKEKIAVITNSSLIYRKDVQDALRLADFVMLKLDACSEDLFIRINKPLKGITFDKILKGMKQFRSRYRGKLALQIMFIGENSIYAKDLARIAKEIAPDEVQINTPLRQCAVMPLSKKETDIIKRCFSGMNISYVYEGEKKKTTAFNKKDTLKRRGDGD